MGRSRAPATAGAPNRKGHPVSTAAHRRIAVLAVGVLLVALIPLVAQANHINDHRNIILPDPNPNGPTEWSIRWSSETFADGSVDTIIIGQADDFPDALASGLLQGGMLAGGSPLLLTDTNSLSTGIVEEAQRLGAETFDVVGGELAVSANVVAQLEAAGLELGERLSGDTRFETAVAIADRLVNPGPEGGVLPIGLLQGQGTVLIVRGEGATEPTQGFADALAAGGWSAADQLPILLTQTDVLHPATEAFLEENSTLIQRAVIVGGDSAVGGTNVSQLEALGLTVERVSGDERASTAIAVAEARGFDAVADADRFLVIESERPDSYALGFPAAAHSAVADAPIVLLSGSAVPAATATWLAGGTDRSEGVTTGDPLFICGAAPPACAGPVRDAIDLPVVGNNGADVTLDRDAEPYAVGDTLTGQATFDPDFTASMEVVGPCIDDVTVTESGAFTVEVTSGTTDEDSADTCTARYTVTYDNGTTQVGMFPFTLSDPGAPGEGGEDDAPLPDLPLPLLAQ
jgi:putative cell wall-binding protein